MIKFEEDQKYHSYILWNSQPKTWEQEYTPISRAKARELEKLRKVGKLPSKFYVIEYGISDYVDADGYSDTWVKDEFDDIRKRQNLMSSFFGGIIKISMPSARFTA